MLNYNTAVLSGNPKPMFETADVRETEKNEISHTNYKILWNRFIYEKLVEWGRGTTAMEDDGFIPPTPEVIDKACEKAQEWRDSGFPPPTRVVPDGEGGISFKRDDGDISESLSIYTKKSGEFLRFEGCHLSERRRLQF